MNRTVLIRVALSVALVATLTGCSLLKVSLDAGNALPEADARTRVMTRGLYYDLSNELVAAADSIAQSDDVQTRIRAIRWKIHTTRAAVSAAMQSIPDVALADTWILCRRMETAFASRPDSLLFGPYSPLARETTHRMSVRADSVASDALDRSRYLLMREYVERYVAENPLGSDAVAPNTTLAWLEFMKEKGVEISYASGSIADVMADMSDRLSGQTGQAVNSLSWTKDIIEIEWERDSTALSVQGQLDSLERKFERIVLVMENIPQISDDVMQMFNKNVESLMGTMEQTLDVAFGQIDRQRNEIQRYVSSEREAVLEQSREAARDVAADMMDRLPPMIRDVAVWLALMAIVVLGLPFAAGYWVGTLRERLRKSKRTDEEK